MLGIDLDEFKACKRVIEENFKKIMRGQLVPAKSTSIRKKNLNDPEPDMQDITMDYEHKIKSEVMMFNESGNFNGMMMPFD